MKGRSPVGVRISVPIRTGRWPGSRKDRIDRRKIAVHKEIRQRARERSVLGKGGKYPRGEMGGSQSSVDANRARIGHACRE